MSVYIDLLRRNKNFRYLWIASVISWAGDWFNTIATIVLVNRYTDSSLAVSGLFLARTLPFFLFSPFAGVIVDRVNRKLVLVTSDILRFVIVMGFLFVDSREEAWMIYVLLILQYIVSSFFQPASSAVMPALVSNEDLVSANVLSSITWSAMLALGSAVGGGFTSLFGVRFALIFDSFSFLISALMIMKISFKGHTGASASTSSTGLSTGWTDFLYGLSYLKQHRDVALLTLVKGLGMIGSTDIMIVMFAENRFPMGEEGATSLGILYGAAGIGSILGPIISQKLTKGRQNAIQYALVAGFLLIAVAWAVLGFSFNIWLAMLGFLLFEMGFSTNWTNSTVLIQFKVSDHLLGRIFSLDLAFFTLVMSFAMWFSGYLMDRYALAAAEVALIFSIASLLPLIFFAAVIYRIHNRQVEI